MVLTESQVVSLLRAFLHRPDPSLSKQQVSLLIRIALQQQHLESNTIRTLLGQVLVLAKSPLAWELDLVPTSSTQLRHWISVSFQKHLQSLLKNRKRDALDSRLDALRFYVASHQPGDGWTSFLWHYHIQWQLQQPARRQTFLFTAFSGPDYQERLMSLPAADKTFDILIRAHLQERDLHGARAVLDQRESIGYAPSAHMYACMLEGYRSLGGHRDLLQLVTRDTGELELGAALQVNNALLSLYITDHQLKEAWSCFLTRFDLSPLYPMPTSPRPRPNAQTFALVWRVLCHPSPQQRPPDITATTLWSLMTNIPVDIQLDRPLLRSILSEALFGRGSLEEVEETLLALDEKRNPFPLPLAPNINSAGQRLHDLLLERTLQIRGLAAGVNQLKRTSAIPGEKGWCSLVKAYAAEPDVSAEDVTTLLDEAVSRHKVSNARAQELYAALHPRAVQQTIEQTNRAVHQRTEHTSPNATVKSNYGKASDTHPTSRQIARRMQNIVDTRLDDTTELLWTILRDRVVLAGMRPHSAHIYPIICSYSHQRDVRGAERAVRYAKEDLGVDCTPAVYTKLMQTMIENDKMANAWRVMWELEKAGSHLDSRSFIPFLKHFATVGNVSQVFRLDRMARSRRRSLFTTWREDLISLGFLYRAKCNLARRLRQYDFFLKSQRELLETLQGSELSDKQLEAFVDNAWRSLKSLQESASEDDAGEVIEATLQEAERCLEAIDRRLRELRLLRRQTRQRLFEMVRAS